MHANQTETPSAVSEIAVSETLRHVNAKALELLTRRKQLTRQISRLNKMMKGLRDLLANADSSSRSALPPAQASATTWATPRNYNLPSEWTVGQIESSTPSRSRHLGDALTRACRIALLEAGGTASPDEICRLILRRGSFLFAHPRSANEEINRTLKAMTASGEVRLVDNNSQLLWRVIAPERETETHWDHSLTT